MKTAEKASTGSRSTVESRAALADTVRWGCWWPWGYEGHEENQGLIAPFPCSPALPDTSVLRECRQHQGHIRDGVPSPVQSTGCGLLPQPPRPNWSLTVMTSRMLRRLLTLSPGTTSFTTHSFPSCNMGWGYGGGSVSRTALSLPTSLLPLALTLTLTPVTTDPADYLRRLWACFQLLSAHLKRPPTLQASGEQGPSPLITSRLPISLRCPRRWPTHRPWEAELQQPVLYHVDAGIWLAWPEDVITLAEPLEDHVPAEFQKQWLLEVAQHSVGRGRRNAGHISPQLSGTPTCTLTLTGHS